VNIGWLLHLHAEYFNQEKARANLQQRMEREEADLNSFCIHPHMVRVPVPNLPQIPEGESSLRLSPDNIKKLPECLNLGREDPQLTDLSNTGDWKLIPFAQNTLTELITKQHLYLHEVKAISFINLESLEGSFRLEIV